MDYQAALDPHEFHRFVAMVREIDAAKGLAVPHPFSPEETKYRKYSKKSIVAARDLPAGTPLDENDLVFLRAEELGLPPGPDFPGSLAGPPHGTLHRIDWSEKRTFCEPLSILRRKVCCHEGRLPDYGAIEVHSPLPKKLLREIKGKPILWHMLDRLRLAKRVDQIILCTSPIEEDRPLVELAAAAGVGSYCGDPDNVILRLSGAARQFKLDYCLNITADCPLVDPVYADKVVEAFLRTKADLIRAFDLPHGAYSYGIRPEALAKIIEIKDSKETEVWGRYFTDTDLFSVYDLPIENPLHRKPLLRMTLDYPEDLAFFQAVFDELYREGEVFSLDQILDLLERRPDIVAINSSCRKAFTRRITKQAEISLKARMRSPRPP